MTNVSALEKIAEHMQRMEENSPRVAALQYSLKLVGEKMEEGEKRIAELEQKLAESQREFRAADATIENMQMQFEKLAAESAGLKAAAKETLAHWAAAEAGKMELMMDKCMPGLRDAYCETPATEAVLAEVRAQGVEMFARETEKLEWHESTVRFVLKFAAQLRKGGAA